ncbi:MAG: 50S ribosomal protein L13 [Myxococcales bacterium]|nr:50S ribosomal protein L13 [Myxococcales bacterium]|tara:strand:+ start:649 stop:1089 length:441 start_codon:yes stop_codon:yes gene_type:complete
MKTLSISTEQAERNWVIVDASDIAVGRLATRVAAILRGKNKPTYTPHADTGDFVVIVNAANVALTGKKWADKVYYHHTGYMGGIKSITAEKLHEKDPTAIVTKAVKGMLPRGPLGRKMFLKLKVYAGSDHPHAAQKPSELDLKSLT